MKALLQKSCPTCTKSSVQTYYYNIKALAKLAGYEEPPKHGTLASPRNVSETVPSPTEDDSS